MIKFFYEWEEDESSNDFDDKTLYSIRNTWIASPFHIHISNVAEDVLYFYTDDRTYSDKQTFQ